MTKQLIAEAISNYGDNVVSEVMQVVSMSDADGAFSLFEDMGYYDHSEVVELLYFNND
jgi:hypothetical protein